MVFFFFHFPSVTTVALVRFQRARRPAGGYNSMDEEGTTTFRTEANEKKKKSG